MKNTFLLASIIAAFGVSEAHAVFTPLTDGVYRLEITGGCFDFGNCQSDGTGTLVDNTTQNQADMSDLGLPYGSGIVGDGLVGVIDFTLSGGNISVTSFSQDSYLNTAGRTFYLRSTNLDTMGGSIDALGNMIFDPTGRQGLFDLFADSYGENPWNFDDQETTGMTIDESTGNIIEIIYPAPNATNLWTTGTSTNRWSGFNPPFTVTGSALQDTWPGMWTGTVVSAGNVGSAWGAFADTPYSEVFNITISSIPIPASIWLFGSGLLGLTGIARRKNAALQNY